MMISHHMVGDNGNGPDRVIECILTHKRHKRHWNHQYSQWSSKSLLLSLMKILVAPEDKGLDRVSEHLYMHIHQALTDPDPSRRSSDCMAVVCCIHT